MVKGYQDSMYQEGLEDEIWEPQSPWLPPGLTSNTPVFSLVLAYQKSHKLELFSPEERSSDWYH